jgi:hypothetical protein
VLNPSEGQIVVAGVTCTVRRIKLRELLYAIRVLTNGMRGGLAEVEFDQLDQSAWIGLMMSAIPNAVDEFVDLMNILIRPPDGVAKADLERVQAELENPDPDLLLDLVPIVVAQEQQTFELLLGKATRLLESKKKQASVAKKVRAKK